MGKFVITKQKAIGLIYCTDGWHTYTSQTGWRGSSRYQGRKSVKSTNSLFLSDNQEQMLVVSSSQSGEHNDVYEIETIFKEIIAVLEQAGIICKGVFLNVDPSFDCQQLQQICTEHDIELNANRTKEIIKSRMSNTVALMRNFISDEQRLNTLMHGWTPLKALLIRYETKMVTWMTLL